MVSLAPGFARRFWFWADSRWAQHGLSWVGGCGFAGHAVNPSMGAWQKHPCFWQSRKPAPADPRRCVGGQGRSTAVSIIFMRYRPRWRCMPSFGNRRYRTRLIRRTQPGTRPHVHSAYPLR